MKCQLFSLMCLLLLGACRSDENHPDQSKIVVLTFDDAVKSHRTFVAPLLKELGFGATFFITYRWMDDTTHFMSWQDVAQLDQMGFEIGNHSWSHLNFAQPDQAARLAGELGLIEIQLDWMGIPKPVSFAYSGNGFGPEAVKTLEAMGYKFARRGMQPEIPYGQIVPGPLYDPDRHHPLLIPTAGDAYPEWDLDHFKKVVDRAGNGKIAVVQFHGVPDPAHDWVSTEPELFKACMEYLKSGGFKVIALKDLESFLPRELPEDTMRLVRYASPNEVTLKDPVEVNATRRNLPGWLTNMFFDHQYSIEEARVVTQLSTERLTHLQDSLQEMTEPGSGKAGDRIKIKPYPGGRHPRIGFLEGALDPMRGTKFSAFLPWDPGQYVVVDLPEAIFSNLGLTFLAHKHLPTIWDLQRQFIDNVDWEVKADGSLENTWNLPNGISIGARAAPGEHEVNMELWLFNGTSAPLDSLKTQVCVMLKGAEDFNQLDSLNKTYLPASIAAGSTSSNRWILTNWENTFHYWDNPDVPCIHADPQFADCPPGDTVRLKGKLWFFEGSQAELLHAAGGPSN